MSAAADPTDRGQGSPVKLAHVLFDPDELLVRYAAGVPLAELCRRPPLPPGVSPRDVLRW